MNRGISLAEILISLVCVVVVCASSLPTILKNEERSSEINDSKLTFLEQKQLKEEKIEGLRSMRIDYPEGSYRIFIMRHSNNLFVIPLDKDK